MYTIVTALGKTKKEDKSWENFVIDNCSFLYLFLTYSKVYVTLIEPITNVQVGFDLEILRKDYSTSPITFQAFLTANANTYLTTDKPPIVRTKKYVKTADVFHAGYKVRPINSALANDAQVTIGDKPDLLLTRKETDYLSFANYAIVNVNGFFHFTETDENGIYVKDGMRSCVMSGKNHASILSFLDVGQITCLPITQSMIYKRDVSTDLKDACYLNLGTNINNKVVLLVIGGYLHIPDKNIFYNVGDTTLRISINNLSLIKRYYESRDSIDLSSLPIEKSNQNDSLISIASLFSDETITKYLTLSQSYVILLDINEFFVERDYLRKTPCPDVFISYTDPMFPVVAGYGKVVNHWYTFEDGQYSISCNDTMLNNYVYETVDPDSLTTVSSIRSMPKRMETCPAYFLKFGTMK